MTNDKPKYSLTVGLEKTLFKALVMIGPLLIGVLPEDWMNLTIGMILAFLVNYAKNKTTKKV